MPVPYTFGTATAAIPLSQLDSNFATAVTIGNTAVQLGNTVTTLNNITLANVTISSGNVTITNVAVTTANVSGTANVSSLVVLTNETVLGNTAVTGNVTASINVTGAKLIPTGSSVTGNGLYLPAANALGLSTNGTNAVYIDSSQNVGVGITSPSTPLHVQANSSGLALRVQGRSDGYADISLYNNANTVNNAFFSSTNTTTFLGTGTTIPLTFQTNNVERMRVNAGAPILCLSGGSTTATGTGIAFPATQSASTDANTLDDYEEGSWTPTDGSGAGLTFTVNSATYTKIGNTVRVSFYGNYPTTANANGASISGLPFTVSNYGSATILSSDSAQSALVRGVLAQTKTDVKALSSDTTVTNVQLSGRFLIFTLVYIV